MHKTLMPGTPAPDLGFPVLGGEAFDLKAARPENFSVILFYRGVHCPKCRLHIKDLKDKQARFEAEGMIVAAVSMDDRERAERQWREWEVEGQPLGYGLTESQARAWGLYLSSKTKASEPDLFCEPAIAVIKPDGIIQALYYQSVPFARPELQTLLDGLVFIRDNAYPIRGIS